MNCLLPDSLLVKTKFLVPHPRTGIVPRPQLVEKLDGGLTTRLILVSAQAGFGKTTCLSHWLRKTGHRAAWLTLDAADDESTRFASALVAAFQSLDPQLGLDAQSRLSSAGCNALSLSDVLSSLLNDLVNAQPRPILLVLDDYHLITQESIHTAVCFFIDHLPPHAHLVIATRTDPPLPLPRLRVRSDLTEIRASDLRFSQGEAAEFLNGVMSLHLSMGDVSTLQARTEGWAAGLQLAALSLRGRNDLNTVPTSFSGSQPLVLDYIVEEILTGQPEPVRRFLLSTSILDRMTAALCDVITGQQNGAVMLRTLERANLFIVPLDDGCCCYRYHTLFAEALRQHLQSHSRDEFIALHLRAAAWYEQHDMPDQATAHRLAADDLPQILNRPAGQDALNERELEILRRVAAGQSNREIGEALSLTTGTVKWYLTNILSKLDAHNRTEAVTRARQNGLLKDLTSYLTLDR